MRPAETYRAARRNEVLRPTEGEPGVWEGRKPTGRVYRAPVRLNRSQRWKPIKSYANHSINHPRKHKALV